MATTQRPRPPRRRKRRAAATGSRRPSTRSGGQGGIAALAIALVLGALGLSRSRFGADGAADDGRRTDGDPRTTSTADARSSGAAPRTPSAAEAALLSAINGARKDRGLPELRASAPLGRAARGHSADLRATSRCSHDGSDGSSLEDRLAAVDVRLQRYGEVVACGSASAEAAVEQWLGSKAHRDILFGPDYRSVGVGVALGRRTSDARWTAVLGTP